MAIGNRHLAVGQIYKSVHGEMPYQGKLTAVVRLSGCSAGCSYCDSKAFWRRNGKRMTFGEIISRVRRLKVDEVLVTGGEPLEQPQTKDLIKRLLDIGFSVTLETDGSWNLRGLPKGTTVVMDLKAPSSGSLRGTLFSNLARLKKGDVLKVVVAGKRDYDWAKRKLAKRARELACEVVFSPVYGKLSPRGLYRIMMSDNSKHRMQIQLHRYLGIK